MTLVSSGVIEEEDEEGDAADDGAIHKALYHSMYVCCSSACFRVRLCVCVSLPLSVSEGVGG